MRGQRSKIKITLVLAYKEDDYIEKLKEDLRRLSRANGEVCGERCIRNTEKEVAERQKEVMIERNRPREIKERVNEIKLGMEFHLLTIGVSAVKATSDMSREELSGGKYRFSKY